MTKLSLEQQLQELSNRLGGNRNELSDLVKTLGEVTGTKHNCAILDVAESASLITQYETTLAEIDAASARINVGLNGINGTSREAIGCERLLII